MDLFKNKSYREGFRDGYEEGRRDGYALGRASASTDRTVEAPQRPAETPQEPLSVPAGHQLVSQDDVELIACGAVPGQIVKPLANSMGEPIGFVPYQEQ